MAARSQDASSQGVDRKVVDARAAALRAQVEQLAKASFQEQSQAATAVAKPSIAATSNNMIPQIPCEAGDELPLLIKSTDMGVYVKWALLLQEELQRSLSMQEQLVELRGKLELENASLCDALGRPRRPVPLPVVMPAAPPLVDAPGPSAAAEPASSGLSAMPPPSLPSGGGATHPGLSGMVQHAMPQVASAGKRTLSTMMSTPRAPRERLEDMPALSASGAADGSGSSSGGAAAVLPNRSVAKLRQNQPPAALPMSSQVSLSDLDLPSSPELGRMMAQHHHHQQQQMPQMPRPSAQMTPNSQQRLVNVEEERLLESLLSSPSLNPDLLSTPNLRQLSSAIDARVPAHAWTDRCAGAAGNAFASIPTCVPSK